MKPDIAVIIPCHNHGDVLARAIDSALPQAQQVIVINDGSLDNTAAVMNRYPGITPLTLSQNHGVVFARNLALHATYCSYALPLDADDWLEPEAARWLWEAVQKQPRSVVYGDYNLWHDGLPKRHTAAPPSLLVRKNVAHATYLYSVAEARRAGGYAREFEIGCEDWALMLSLQQAGNKITYLPKTILNKTSNENGRAAACLPQRDEIARRLRQRFGVTV